MTNQSLELKPVGNVFAGIMAKVKTAHENAIALPQREVAMTENQTNSLRAAISTGWEAKEKRGPWSSGEHGFEEGPLLGIEYKPLEIFTEAERIAIINEAKRTASKRAILEYLATLSAHKRYTGGDGFTFVASDIAGYISHFSELAIRNAFDSLKLDDSPWFPTASEIVRMVQFEQDKIEGIAA